MRLGFEIYKFFAYNTAFIVHRSMMDSD